MALQPTASGIVEYVADVVTAELQPLIDGAGTALANIDAAKVAAVAVVATEGTTQIAAVNGAGATELGSIDTAGNTFVNQLNGAGSSLATLPTLTSRSQSGYEAAYTGAWAAIANQIANGVTDLMTGFVVGTDIAAGTPLDRIVVTAAANTGATKARVRIYRLLASSPDIDTPTAIVATSVLATLDTTPTAVGMTVGANTLKECAFDIPSAPVAEAGYIYYVRFDLRDNADAQIAIAYGYATATGAAANRRGWNHQSATPSTWSVYTANRRIYFDVYRKNLIGGAQANTVALAAKAQLTAARRSTACRNFGDVFANNARAIELHKLINGMVTLPNGLTGLGDSNTQGGTGGVAAYTTLLGNFLTGTVYNLGTGGATSTTIKNNYVAATAPQKAADVVIMMGTNDGNIPATVLANYAAVITAAGHTNYLCVAPIIDATSSEAARPTGLRLERELVAIYGNKALNLPALLRAANSHNDDLNAMILGQPGVGLFSDTKHLSEAGIRMFAEHIARYHRARYGSVPYVHSGDVFAWDSGMALGAAIGTPRYVGTCNEWQIVAGNCADLVRINNRTGAITRGAGTTYPDTGVLQLIIRARGATGPDTYAFVTLVRAAETIQPIYPVAMQRIQRNGSSVYGAAIRQKDASESFALMADATSFSFVMRHKFNRGDAQGQFMAGPTSMCFSDMSNNVLTGAMSHRPRNVGNTANLASATGPIPADPYGINWHFFSFNGATGAWTVATNASSSSGTGTAGTVGLGLLQGFFNSQDGGNSPFFGSHYMTWIAPSFIDFTSSTERERFYNPADFSPQTMVADGTVNSIAPSIYLRGRAGDYYTSPNKAAGGLQVYTPPPVTTEDMLFVDVTS